MNPLLQRIEYYGNKIPHPSLMFFWLCVAIAVISVITNLLEVNAVNPLNGDMIDARSLASAEGIRFMLTKMVTNFTGFAPLGVVLVAMLGIGIAEKSGVLTQALKGITRFAQGKMLTGVVAFAGVMSSLAADSGYVILVPLAALLFKTAGRPALEGIAVSFAGVAGGFSANLLVGPLDAVLAGISTESARLVLEDATVLPTSNWLFGIISTVFVTFLITVVTHYRDWKSITEGQELATKVDDSALNIENVSFKGLSIYSLLFVTVVALLSLPQSAPLRDPVTGSLAKSPLVDSIVVIIALYFAGLGMVYGRVNRVFSNAKDIIIAMEDTMITMAGYLVMMFFAAQFIAYFSWTNLGLIIAVNGANMLTTLDISESILLILFVFMSAFINLFIGSASAKWALMAPVFIPMLYLLGISPELTQMAYRIGDSSTNMITPMMPYFALVLSFTQRHYPKAGMGTLMAAMLPYSIVFILAWTALFIIWLQLGLPIGL